MTAIAKGYAGNPSALYTAHCGAPWFAVKRTCVGLPPSPGTEKRTLIMGAPDERAMMAWVEALRTAIFAAETIAHGGSRIKVRESKVGAGGGGGAGDMPLGIFHVRSGEAGDISGAINTQHLGVAYCM